MKEFDSVRTLVDAEGWNGAPVPAGTVGAIVDVLSGGRGFAVDVLVNGEPDLVVVDADQVEPYDDLAAGTEGRGT